MDAEIAASVPCPSASGANLNTSTPETRPPLAFLGFLALPIRVTTIYDGLPAHPLFVHVPVILIPTTVVVAVVFMFKQVASSRCSARI